jgi:hypothetical protein
MLLDEQIKELTTNLGGIILKKAELENNFDRVYSMVFQKMYDLEEVEGDEFLLVLGEIGG